MEYPEKKGNMDYGMDYGKEMKGSDYDKDMNYEGGMKNEGQSPKEQGYVDAKGEIAAGFLPRSERPYCGNLEGRIEDSKRDADDEGLRNRGESIENSRISEGKNWAAQHGNVGFAGSYPLDWKVER